MSEFGDHPRKGEHPDYKIMALNKVTGQRGQVGAAWDNDEGRIGLRFEPFVDLNQLRSPDVLITLFTNVDKPHRRIDDHRIGGGTQPRERHPRGSRRGK
jgi:hypothetical protein